MIIGQPKSLADVPELSEEAKTGLYQAGEQLLASGQPLDMPTIALTGIDFAIFIKTLKALSEKNAELEARIELLEEPGGDTPSGLPLSERGEGDNLDLSNLLGKEGEA